MLLSFVCRVFQLVCSPIVCVCVIPDLFHQVIEDYPAYGLYASFHIHGCFVLIIVSRRSRSRRRQCISIVCTVIRDIPAIDRVSIAAIHDVRFRQYQCHRLCVRAICVPRGAQTVPIRMAIMLREIAAAERLTNDDMIVHLLTQGREWKRTSIKQKEARMEED